MNPPDPRYLKAVQHVSEERERRIRAERSAQALKLQNVRLRALVRKLTADAAPIRENSPSRESGSASAEHHPAG